MILTLACVGSLFALLLLYHLGAFILYTLRDTLKVLTFALTKHRADPPPVSLISVELVRYRRHTFVVVEFQEQPHRRRR